MDVIDQKERLSASYNLVIKGQSKSEIKSSANGGIKVDKRSQGERKETRRDVRRVERDTLLQEVYDILKLGGVGEGGWNVDRTERSTPRGHHYPHFNPTRPPVRPIQPSPLGTITTLNLKRENSKSREGKIDRQDETYGCTFLGDRGEDRGG